MVWTIITAVVGWYFGVGTAVGAWSYFEDEFNDPRHERIVIAAILFFYWGPLLAIVLIDEEVLR